MISENLRLGFQRSHSTVHLVSHWKVLLRGDESLSEVDARKSEVSNASQKTRNLCQGAFVRLRFASKPIG
jgi:hypothetical protein